MIERTDIAYNREQIGARVRVHAKMHLSFKVILYHAKELYFSEIRSVVSRNYTRVMFAFLNVKGDGRWKIQINVVETFVVFIHFLFLSVLIIVDKKFMKYLRMGNKFFR